MADRQPGQRADRRLLATVDHRLALTKARPDALERSLEPLTNKALLGILGRGPKVLDDFSNDLFGRKPASA